MAQKKKPIQRSLEGIPNHVPFELWFMILGVYDYIFLQRFRLINKAYKQLVESYQPHHLQLFLTENTFNTLKRIKITYQEAFRELRTVAFMLPKDNIKFDAIFTNICSQFEDCKKLEKVYTPLMNVSVSLPANIVSAEFMLKFNVQQSLESPSALIQWLRNQPIIDCWGDLLYVLEKYLQRGTYFGSPAQLGRILENLVLKWNCPMDIIDLFLELGADVHINTLAELYKGKKLSLNKFQRLIQKYKQKLLVDSVTKESLLSLISRKDDGNNLCHWIFKYSSAYLEEIMEGLGKDISTDLNRVNIHEVAPVFYLFTQPSISSTAFLKPKSLDLDLDSKITRKAILTDPQFEKSDLRKFCKLHTKKQKLSLFQIIISMTNWTKIVEQHLPNDPSLLNQKNLIFWTCSRHKSLWPQSWSTNPQFQTLIDLHDVVFGRRDLASVINPQPVFMEAGKYGLYPIVKDFVNRRNGDINLKRRDQKGNTILHLLAKTQPHNSEFLLPLKQILRFLTTKGAPDVKNNDGLSFKDILQTRLNSSTVPII